MKIDTPPPPSTAPETAQGVSAIDVINDAIDSYKPLQVFALFSGGNDSVCSAHIASHAKKFDGVVFVDTGIKIQQALDHACATAERFGWPFQVVETPEKYEEIVSKHGFPGASAHRYMYIMLKERAIDKLMRENKTKRNQNIMLITGVRQHESARRMENVTGAVVKQKSKIWVAPLWDWTNDAKNAYMKQHNLPENPIKKIMHVSGDCLCGAYNDKGDLQMLKAFFPDEARRIEKLQAEVMKTHPWAWDEMPPKWWKQYQAGQRFLGNDFSPLCWNCDIANTQDLTPRRDAGHERKDERMNNCPICKHELMRVHSESQCQNHECPLYLLVLPQSDFDKMQAALAAASADGYEAALEQATRVAMKTGEQCEPCLSAAGAYMAAKAIAALRPSEAGPLPSVSRAEFERLRQFFADVFNGSIRQDYETPQAVILGVQYEDAVPHSP